ncbi:GNAT family N-acetyltransferase [Nocardia sp. AG03]|uniref:GNAT family N-acetyltransferase n=1 Tax=Nocardia sp. AG03 TaxID=3025312 RepID=UPI002418A755|nr:GNAT family N-acetyltransferase [Nocardia sp. AG03]
MAGHEIRRARPGDYDDLIAVVDNWWGRTVVQNLPRMFLDHFHRTSLVAADEDGISGFLVGFGSPSQPRTAYIHFVAVRPDARKAGLGRTLYDRFFELARADGREVVQAITSPANFTSIDFHRSLGFTVVGPVADYNGPGRALITFARTI